MSYYDKYVVKRTLPSGEESYYAGFEDKENNGVYNPKWCKRSDADILMFRDIDDAESHKMLLMQRYEDGMPEVNVIELPRNEWKLMNAVELDIDPQSHLEMCLSLEELAEDHIELVHSDNGYYFRLKNTNNTEKSDTPLIKLWKSWYGVVEEG